MIFSLDMNFQLRAKYDILTDYFTKKIKLRPIKKQQTSFLLKIGKKVLHKFSSFTMLESATWIFYQFEFSKIKLNYFKKQQKLVLTTGV